MIRPFLEDNMTITRRSALLGAAALPFAQSQDLLDDMLVEGDEA